MKVRRGNQLKCKLLKKSYALETMKINKKVEKDLKQMGGERRAKIYKAIEEELGEKTTDSTMAKT